MKLNTCIKNREQTLLEQNTIHNSDRRKIKTQKETIFKMQLPQLEMLDCSCDKGH